MDASQGPPPLPFAALPSLLQLLSASACDDGSGRDDAAVELLRNAAAASQWCDAIIAAGALPALVARMRRLFEVHVEECYAYLGVDGYSIAVTAQLLARLCEGRLHSEPCVEAGVLPMQLAAAVVPELQQVEISIYYVHGGDPVPTNDYTRMLLDAVRASPAAAAAAATRAPTIVAALRARGARDDALDHVGTGAWRLILTLTNTLPAKHPVCSALLEAGLMPALVDILYDLDEQEAPGSPADAAFAIQTLLGELYNPAIDALVAAPGGLSLLASIAAREEPRRRPRRRGGRAARSRLGDGAVEVLRNFLDNGSDDARSAGWAAIAAAGVVPMFEDICGPEGSIDYLDEFDGVYHGCRCWSR